MFLLEFVIASRLADGVTWNTDIKTQQVDDSQMFQSSILSAVQIKFPWCLDTKWTWSSD